MLTQQELKECLTYDPVTGEFARNKRAKKNKSGGVGSFDTRGYVNIRIGKTRYLAHRMAWLYVYGEWPSELDHINRDKSDNRISNLRIASRAQNSANRVSKAKSGYKGVIFTKGKWRGSITINNKSMGLGTFDTAEEAHIAYCEAARKAFGQFACMDWSS